MFNLIVAFDMLCYPKNKIKLQKYIYYKATAPSVYKKNYSIFSNVLLGKFLLFFYST